MHTPANTGAAPPVRTADVRLLVALSALLAAGSGVQVAVETAGEPEGVPIAPHRVPLATASVDELGALPGVGPKLARRLAAARERGALASEEDLLEVPGIGPALAGRIAPHADFGHPAGPH